MTLLSSLVCEALQDRAELLNKLLLLPFAEQEFVITDIWKLLVCFASDASAHPLSEEKSGGLPSWLDVYDQRYRFIDDSTMRDVTFSRSSLKKFALRILRRLFEAAPFDFLKDSPCFTAKPNIVNCIRSTSSDLSVVLYVMNGINVEPRDVSGAFKAEIYSIVADLVAFYGPSAVSDESTWHIAWNFLAKYYRSSNLFSKHHACAAHCCSEARVLAFLLVNFERWQTNHPSFLKYLVYTARSFGFSLPNYERFKRMVSSLSRNIQANVELVRKEHLVLFRCVFDMCDAVSTRNLENYKGPHSDLSSKHEFFSPFFLHPRLALLEQELKDEVIRVFFCYYFRTRVDADGLQGLRNITGNDSIARLDDLLIEAMLYSAKGMCPAAFIVSVINGNETRLDMMRLVTSKEYLAFVGANFFGPKRVDHEFSFGSYTMDRAHLTRHLENERLLKATVESGLLRSNREIIEACSDIPDDMFLLRSLVYEQDHALVNDVLRRFPDCYNAHNLCSWTIDSARTFFERHWRYLDWTVVDAFLRSLPTGKLMLAYQEMPRRIHKRLLDDASLKLRRCKYMKKIKWLKPRDSDAPKIRLRKQLILGQVNTKEALLYLQSPNADPVLLKKIFFSKAGLGIINGKCEIEELSEDDAKSPIIEYSNSLPGAAFTELSRSANPLLANNFLLLDTERKRIGRARIASLSRHMEQLPVALYFNDNELLVEYIRAKVRGYRAKQPKLDPVWIEGIAQVAEMHFGQGQTPLP